MADSENDHVRLHAIYHALRADILSVAKAKRVIPAAVPDIARRAAPTFDIDHHGELTSLTGETVSEFIERLEQTASFMFYPRMQVAA